MGLRRVCCGTALAVLLPASVASAASGGGAVYRASTRAVGGVTYADPAGGVSYASRVPRFHPVATLLRVPRSVRAGRMPRVRYRLDERGVEAVRVRISVVALGRHPGRRVIADQGTRATGVVHRVRWPSHARLGRGRWQVRIHAVDPDGHGLKRTASAAGTSVLRVRRRHRHRSEPVPAPTPTPTPTPTPAPSGSGVFPVAGPHSFGGPDNAFNAGRKGHLHQGQDVLAAEGTPVVAPEAGTITARAVQASAAGYYLTLHAADGRDMFFAHCEAGSFAVSLGQAVGAGQRLCRVGQTGDATGPHLHFEIWVGGWKTGAPIDPLPQLEAWDG